MSENGEFYTTGKNFTLPPGLAGWPNSTSDYPTNAAHKVELIAKETKQTNKQILPQILHTQLDLQVTTTNNRQSDLVPGRKDKQKKDLTFFSSSRIV